MIDKDNLEFHPHFVNPYYGGLMNLSFMSRYNQSERMDFLNSVKKLENGLSNEDICTLLHSGMRPSKVGAWIIGLCKIQELEYELIYYLNTRPIYCEHVLSSLASLQTNAAKKAISNFLSREIVTLQKHLENGKGYLAMEQFDKHSLRIAFSALKYLDTVHGSHLYEEVIRSKKWTAIKKEWLKIIKQKPREMNFYLAFLKVENIDSRFEEAMEFIQNLDESK
ncbi:MAG: DUF6000 family protein [Saprospiraceae bacterium]|nr:DUF6000 family protein [Saprospiraceae bacterium]